MMGNREKLLSDMMIIAMEFESTFAMRFRKQRCTFYRKPAEHR